MHSWSAERENDSRSAEKTSLPRIPRFTMREAQSSAKAAPETRPPSVTARNAGPLLISAAASHARTASTDRSR